VTEEFRYFVMGDALGAVGSVHGPSFATAAGASRGNEIVARARGLKEPE
jgi:hypothetical protein